MFSITCMWKTTRIVVSRDPEFYTEKEDYGSMENVELLYVALSQHLLSFLVIFSLWPSVTVDRCVKRRPAIGDKKYAWMETSSLIINRTHAANADGRTVAATETNCWPRVAHGNRINKHAVSHVSVHDETSNKGIGLPPWCKWRFSSSCVCCLYAGASHSCFGYRRRQ